eukprot:SAG31_NODE_186_length_20918_cov_26.890917_20_plen_220_part_00
MLLEYEPEPEPVQQPEVEPRPDPEAADALSSNSIRYDRFGNLESSESATIYPNEAKEAELEKLRVAKWRKMLASWTNYGGASASKRHSAKLKRRCRKGIPVENRGEAWLKLCGADTEMSKQPGVYMDLATQQPCPSKDEQQILLDVRRTCTEHQSFHSRPSGSPSALQPGQEVLYRVLRAYAVLNRKVSYCQGISYIAAMFLCQGVEEEEAFWMLKQFM